MKKLKKIDNQYIVVDDSDIKEGDGYYTPKDGVYMMEYGICDSISKIKDAIRLTGKPFYKITHSTEPLEKEGLWVGTGYWKNIKPLSFSEMEELTKGYSVDKMAESRYGSIGIGKERANIWISGFKAHEQLVKDKLFTIDDMRKAFKVGQKHGEDNSCNAEIDLNDNEEQFIQSILPPTEWQTEFDEQGKIKIIK